MLKNSSNKCKRNKSVTVSGVAKEAQGLKYFNRSVGRAAINFG